jgi:hypothetical protein
MILGVNSALSEMKLMVPGKEMNPFSPLSILAVHEWPIFIFSSSAPLTKTLSLMIERSAILTRGLPAAVISPASAYYSMMVPFKGLFT